MFSFFWPAHLSDICITMLIIFTVCLQWDQSSMDVFKVLNECDPAQVCFQFFTADF